jgi:regulator of sigma E protease
MSTIAFIAVFILVLGALIFVHELGHFLLAKWNKVGVLEFAIGFGPIIASFRKGETTYSLRAIPLGGFVRMVGDDPAMRVLPEGDASKSAEEALVATYAELDEQQKALVADRSKWFIEKKYLPKIAVVIAGPAFNYIFAFILAISYYYSYGKPSEAPYDLPVIGDTIPDEPAEKVGIKSGDKILSVNGESISTWNALAELVSKSEGKEVNLEIERAAKEGNSTQEKLNIKVTPVLKNNEELSAIVGQHIPPSYKIGISPFVPREPVTGVSEAIEIGSAHVLDMSKRMLMFMSGMASGKVSTQNLGGPIAIFKATQASTERGLESIMRLMIFLNISLAIFNLLPIPILDGGHLVFFTLEAIMGGPLNQKVLERANQVGMILLLILMVFAFGNDIRRLLGII